MARLLGLFTAFVLVVLARLLAPEVFHTPAADATMALGFVLIVSFIIGQIASSYGVPAITGYILTGVFFGPYILTALSPMLTIVGKETVESLRLLDGVALGLIALTAGGELKVSTIRKRFRSISWVVFLQVALVFVGVVLVLFFSRHWFGMLSNLGKGQLITAVMLFGVTALATSPATTIAVIQELDSRGPVTDLTLAVTIVKDVIVMVAFTIVVASGAFLVSSEVESGIWVNMAWEVFGSLALGLALGLSIALYLKYVGREAPLAALGVALLSVAVSEQVHVSAILMCVVAGFYVENFSDHGDDMIKAVERHSMPVYVVFFTIAGAGLDLKALQATWPLAMIIVVSRLLFTSLATYAGARIAGDDDNVRRYGWTGYIGQAGVTLGFAVLIAARFPEIGPPIRTVVVAAIAINQIIGPIIFKWGLNKAGETGRSDVGPG